MIYIPYSEYDRLMMMFENLKVEKTIPTPYILDKMYKTDDPAYILYGLYVYEGTKDKKLTAIAKAERKQLKKYLDENIAMIELGICDDEDLNFLDNVCYPVLTMSEDKLLKIHASRDKGICQVISKDESKSDPHIRWLSYESDVGSDHQYPAYDDAAWIMLKGFIGSKSCHKLINIYPVLTIEDKYVNPKNENEVNLFKHQWRVASSGQDGYIRYISSDPFIKISNSRTLICDENFEQAIMYKIASMISDSKKLF